MMPLTSASLRTFLAREYEGWMAYAHAYQYATSWRGILAASVPSRPVEDSEREVPLVRTLCEACEAQLPRHRLGTLSRLFSTLPLTQVASYVGCTEEQTSSLLQAMSEQGVLHAHLETWDPASMAHAVPLHGSVAEQAYSPMLVRFTEPSTKTSLTALHHTLTSAVSSEQAAEPRLEQAYHAHLLSQQVLSNILAAHAGIAPSSADVDESAAEGDLDAMDDAPAR